jgi:hypothetical protein
MTLHYHSNHASYADSQATWRGYVRGRGSWGLQIEDYDETMALHHQQNLFPASV